MQRLEGYDLKHFALVRMILGVYLLQHFIFLIPYAGETFSNKGLLPQASMNFTYPFFPNILYIWDSPGFVTAFLVLLALMSICLFFGFKRRIVSFVIWYGYACLFNRNNLINNPSLAFVGWVLLAFVCLPWGEKWGIDNENNDWAMPKELFYGAWLVMGVSYTISGLHKLGSPGWVEGKALGWLLENPLGRDYFLSHYLRSFPEGIMKIKTWGVLILEIGFLPLIFFSLGRMVAWSLMTAMHFGILSLVNFPDLTFGVLMMHVFTFDPRWVRLLQKKMSK